MYGRVDRSVAGSHFGGYVRWRPRAYISGMLKLAGGWRARTAGSRDKLAPQASLVPRKRAQHSAGSTQ